MIKIICSMFLLFVIQQNAWAGDNSAVLTSGRIYNLPDSFYSYCEFSYGYILVLIDMNTEQKVTGMNIKLNQVRYVTCRGENYSFNDINKQNAHGFGVGCEESGRFLVVLECNDGYYVDNETHTTKDKCIKQNTVSVVDKATKKPLEGVQMQKANNTNSEGKTLSWCSRGKDNVCAELAGYKKRCQTCKENMVFELEKIVKKPKKTEENKTEEKKSDEKPVTPPAETSGTTNADKDKANNPSGEDGGETPAATENGNGTAAAGNDDVSTKSADDESNETKEQKFDFSKLDAILDEYFSDSSNWKNTDGNFNTARLVSDSVAGVVLGTAGGVITSKIIKKNQIKKGFEDLKCTVGGQDVATYGDEFTVGAKQ